jgi:hypothetical protein
MADSVMVLDFDEAPPVQGGGGEADYIPPDNYTLRVETAEKSESKNGKPMATVRFRVAEGEYTGKRLVERFVFPRAGTDDNNMGLRRFHGLLMALGFAEQRKRGVKIDLEKLSGRECTAQVDDEYQEATEQYPARTRSRPIGFYPVEKEPAEDEDDDEDEEEEVVEEAPKKKAPKDKAKAKKAKEPEPEDEDEDDDEEDMDELDDLL